MANLDITRISDLLTDAAVDANELSNDKTLIKLINNIDSIKDSCAGFGGEVARIVPIQLKAEIDHLTGLYNQVCNTSRTVAEGLKNLVDMLDNIPLGQLRKKSFQNMPDVSSTQQQDNEAAMEEPAVATAPANNGEPKSALLRQDESTDFWRNVRSNVKREAYSFQRGADEGDSNGGVEFGKIKESLKGHQFDLGELNDTNNEETGGQSSEWKSILSSLGGSRNNINEDIARNWDGRVESGAKLHMVETEFNTSNELLGLGKMKEVGSADSDILNGVTFVD